METTIIFIPDSCTKEDVPSLVDKLKRGYVFKFVFDFRVRILTQELYMIICISNTSNEHEIIHAALSESIRKMPNRGFGIDTNPFRLGGGCVKMEDGNFIFYDSSNKYGKYNKDYLALGRQEIATLLGIDVNNVEFQ